MIGRRLPVLFGLLFRQRKWRTFEKLSQKIRNQDAPAIERIQALEKFEKLSLDSDNLKRKEELCEKTVNELYRSVDSLKSEELMNLVIYLAKLKNKRFITVIEVIMNRLDDLDYKQWSYYQIYYLVNASQQLYVNNPKKKKTLHRIIQVLLYHIGNLDLNFIMSYLVFFENLLRKLQPSEKPKHRELFVKIEDRVLTCLKNEGSASKNDLTVLKSPHFYISLLTLCDSIGTFQNKELYSRVQEKILIILNQHLKVSELQFKSWVIFYNKLSISGLASDKLLDWAMAAYQSNPHFKQQVDTYSPEYLGKVCYGYLVCTAVKVFNQIPLKEESCGKVIRKSSFSLPKLKIHPFIAVIAQRMQPNAAFYQQFAMYFPDHFTLKPKISQQYTFYDSTDFREAVRKELEAQGIKYQQEVQVTGRKVDFLINGELVIEVDGDFHYNPTTGIEIGRTVLRNLTYLWSGKRFLVLRLVDYNFARQTGTISSYIRNKIQWILNDKDVIMLK